MALQTHNLGNHDADQQPRPTAKRENYARSSRNATKSGATAVQFDFRNDPEYRHRLRKYIEDLEPRGRAQGDAVAQMVRAIIMTERILIAGHTPDSAARLYATFDRAYHRAYKTFIELREDKGPRRVALNVSWVNPAELEASRAAERQKRIDDGDITDYSPIDPAFDDPDLDRRPTPSIEQQWADLEGDDDPGDDDAEYADDDSENGGGDSAETAANSRPRLHIVTSEPLRRPVYRALVRAVRNNEFEICENGILRLPDYPRYAFRIAPEPLGLAPNDPEMAS